MLVIPARPRIAISGILAGDPGFRHCDFFALAPIGPSGVVFGSSLVVYNAWPARYLAHKLSCHTTFHCSVL